MAVSGAAAEASDLSAGDGAQGRPRRQKRDPRQSQGRERYAYLPVKTAPCPVRAPRVNVATDVLPLIVFQTQMRS